MHDKVIQERGCSYGLGEQMCQLCSRNHPSLAHLTLIDRRALSERMAALRKDREHLSHSFGIRVG